MKLNGYRSLAETGVILGVSEEQVLEWIEHGPLIGRVGGPVGEGIKVLDEDLKAFRRPLGFATTSYSTTANGSEMGQTSNVSDSFGKENINVNGPLIIGLCGYQSVEAATSFQSRRGTSATKAFRVLLDVAEVERHRERFEKFVSPEPNTGCFVWTGSSDKGGYGSFRFSGAIVLPHRFAYVLDKGQIPERTDVDHHCRNRWCVNPAHLEAVPHKENIRRRDAVQTHCLRGHPLSGDNLAYDKNPSLRVCRVCRDLRADRSNANRARHLHLVPK